MEYTHVDRHGIATFEKPGQDSPLVILPGVMADARSWMPVAEAISAPNPIIIINRRGRTPSVGLGEGYGIPVEIADLVHVATSLGEPIHLFGWSYGGLIAIEAAATTDLPIRSLIAYEPVSRPFAPEAIAPIRDALSGGNRDRAVEIINRDISGFDQAYVENLRASSVWLELCRLAEPLGEELAAIDAFAPTYGNYAAIAAKTTLLLGALNTDGGRYREAFDRFAGTMPGALVRTIPGEGHLAHVSNPDLLAKFLTEAVSVSPQTQ